MRAVSTICLLRLVPGIFYPPWPGFISFLIAFLGILFVYLRQGWPIIFFADGQISLSGILSESGVNTGLRIMQ